jgi:hypothetical protein
MHTLLLSISFIVAALPAGAQTGPQSITMSALLDCLKDATSAGDVDHGDSVLVFSCSAAKAKVLYNFLGRKIKTEVIIDRNGKFENRQFGGSACYHRIEDQAGKPADDFRCDLILAIGDALED